MTTPLVSGRSEDWRGGGGDDVGSDTTAAFIRRHHWVVTLGRVGWVAKGVVYALTGILAFTVIADPFGAESAQGDQQASQTGAVTRIAQEPFGEALLWLLAIGLFLYAAWRIVTVLLPADNDGKAWLNRIGYTVSAVVYIALGISAVSLARSPGTPGTTDGSQQEDAKVEKFTRDLLEMNGGRTLVGLIGVLLIGIAVAFVWKGISASFVKQLEQRRVGPFSWPVIRAMGRAGWIGRGAMMGLIGWFIVRSAVQFDPAEAKGLDDSLRRVADDSLGVVLVFVVAIGLLLYGAFCIITAPSVKMVASDDQAAS